MVYLEASVLFEVSFLGREKRECRAVSEAISRIYMPLTPVCYILPKLRSLSQEDNSARLIGNIHPGVHIDDTHLRACFSTWLEPRP